MRWESPETRAARQEARYHADTWRRHQKACLQCTRATRTRTWSALCPEGAEHRAAHSQAELDLQRNLWLDRQPTPGQQSLF